jgi:hypothetical protein
VRDIRPVRNGHHDDPGAVSLGELTNAR